MTLTVRGRIDWGGGREKDMHRTYWVRFLVESDSKNDGPQTLTYAAGLPVVGSSWTQGNDNDFYALCYPTVTCETVIKKLPNYFWVLKYTFSTRPFIACAVAEITNPMSQPDRIVGSFVNYQKRVNTRRDGTAILSSSLEPIWTQRDQNRPTVSITQTLSSLGLSAFSQMINTLNDATLWGMPSRHIKLRNVPWRRLVWGVCTYYYERTLEFDVDYDSFDDTEVRDQGRRVVDPKKVAGFTGTGSLDITDPANFVVLTDLAGNTIAQSIPLNGAGKECSDPANHQHFIDTVEHYNESNFLALGIPATL